MGWVDPQWIPTLQRDGRYGRLLTLTQRLLEEREQKQERPVPKCTCTGGQTTIRDADGHETTVQCDACQGTGELPTYADNEDNGQAEGSR
ncbi:MULTISPECIES: hypothetical protein [Streptomyces]|uniref:Uncharacterized protein n=2 Tax=Streptomyces rimosus subsp. rimosus TaxID=132474 RepID=L8EM61_STRR1|nr:MULTISPECIES: hypothetical protein [Streptomyces]KOG67391.1 hypothetical protein ADK78_40730 [Kitasatospora aureofaciens]MYT44412.1 hypothetical protein [Streptomyces sp. SID5471]KEF08195.1 hypothetical protein DF17_07860 [Streptomyces rimosus]KOT45678.1 hypothetical protein ADK42_02650 [Streptomyces rimosus subsp. rimosus]KOT46954.1 hypothetical protein ADK84_02215 [Streptomyces sp. NRRL WC-3701]